MKKLLIIASIAFNLLSCNAQILKIANFVGYVKNGKIELAFSTITEDGTKSFFIEKSQSGFDFQKCVEFERKGNGSHYLFCDSLQMIGCYYRICETFLDEHIEKREVVFVEKQEKLVVFPNPSNSHLLNILSEKEVTIFDVSGRFWGAFQAGRREIILPKGVYFARSGSEISRIIIQ